MAESALHNIPEEQGLLLHKQATEPKGGRGSSEVSSVAAVPEASSIVYSMSHQRTRGSWLMCFIYWRSRPWRLCVASAVLVSSIVLVVLIVLQYHHFLVVH